MQTQEIKSTLQDQAFMWDYPARFEITDKAWEALDESSKNKLHDLVYQCRAPFFQAMSFEVGYKDFDMQGKSWRMHEKYIGGYRTAVLDVI